MSSDIVTPEIDVLVAVAVWLWPGKPATQRNNFDRALASVVSYYTESPPKDLAAFSNAIQFLGLALPETGYYMSELKHRVSKPLRKTLNLWVLLYNPLGGGVRGIAPDDEY